MWQGFIKMKNIKIIRKTRFQKEISQQYIWCISLGLSSLWIQVNIRYLNFLAVVKTY